MMVDDGGAWLAGVVQGLAGRQVGRCEMILRHKEKRQEITS